MDIKMAKTENWKTEQLASTYIEGVRGAIPLATEQIEIILRIIKYFKRGMASFLDLGCGDGVLGYTLFSNWPDSSGIFLDYSEPMINAAKTKCNRYQNQSTFIVQDFGKKDWIQTISGHIPVDVVVSGFSIHHQDNDRKKRLYKEIFDDILTPGGVFLDLDQVASPTTDIEKMFDSYFLDHVQKYQQESNPNISIDDITKAYYKDKEVNKLAPVEEQCDWLKEIGFKQVDCYFKAFELSIFGGVKPC
jgi:ubiquinone/menaquinone biosynthesis C-methylase UbiE